MKLNAFRQFTVPLGGIDVHFIHEESKGPNPMPLLLCHGCRIRYGAVRRGFA